MNKCKLVVLLENCLKDVPRKDKKPDNNGKPGALSNVFTGNKLSPKTLLTTCVESNCNNENLTNSYGISPDEEEPQPLSLEESLLDLPNCSSCTTASEERTKGRIIKDDSLLSWEKLANPLVCEAKTPHTSGNSSGVDIDLTPPSSVESGMSLFEEDRSFEESFNLDSNDLPCKTDKIDINKKCSKDKELSVEVTPHEPTLYQLQVLYRRNSPSRLIQSNCKQNRLWPKRQFKPFVPFMFEHAEYMKKRNRIHPSKLFNSPPKKKSKKSKVKRLQITRKEKKAIEMKELKMALKEKEAFQKKQLKLVLQQKKAALKYRNKFENSLDSINKRITNQNSFWRMLSG